jgi:hypothetical protein
MGLGRVELPTSPLSGVRSNRLSYRPGPNAGPSKLGSVANASEDPMLAIPRSSDGRMTP